MPDANHRAAHWSRADGNLLDDIRLQFELESVHIGEIALLIIISHRNTQELFFIAEAKAGSSVPVKNLIVLNLRLRCGRVFGFRTGDSRLPDSLILRISRFSAYCREILADTDFIVSIYSLHPCV